MQSAAEQKTTPVASAPSAPDPQLARGRELFVAKCGSCHDADGSKPLRHGPALNRRALSDEVIGREVAPRLRAHSDRDKQAVAAWIRSFLLPPAR